MGSTRVTRACQQCRAAKSKCDHVRPTCGRCARRRTSCTGYTVDGGYVFRDENLVAEQNSQRARGMPQHAAQGGPDSRSIDSRSTHMSNSDSLLDTSSQAAPSKLPGTSLTQLRSDFPWLSDPGIARLSEPPRRDAQTRAVERFFVNWVLFPDSHGVSPGYMPFLPLLYQQSPPDSLLRHSVHALAYADLRDASAGDVPFATRARRSYGEALIRMRQVSQQEEVLAQDQTLIALLLIDSFEVVYLARANLLGPHTAAIEHALRSRVDDQILTRSRYDLWAVANNRIQARQIIAFEAPSSLEIEQLYDLNTELPSLRVTADVLRIAQYSAAARSFAQSIQHTFFDPVTKLEEGHTLLQSMRELLDASSSWKANLANIWQELSEDSQTLLRHRGPNYPQDHPLRGFPCPKVFRFADRWLAYLWSFHAACQMVLHEASITVSAGCMRLRQQQSMLESAQEENHIGASQASINNLSSYIIRSAPRLMGWDDHCVKSVRESSCGPQGIMAGRFLALFAMSIIGDAEHADVTHKQTAVKFVQWTIAKHSLA